MGKYIGTVAQLGLGIAGGFIGSAIGGPAGAKYGFAIGSTLGGLFNRPQQPNASSVLDLKAQLAEPGSYLKEICGGTISNPLVGESAEGGVLTPGIVIAVAPEGGIERVAASSGGGGGGGTFGRLFGSSGGESYEHYLSLALAYCAGDDDHPLSCRLIKADDKVIYDRDATTAEARGYELTPEYGFAGGPFAGVPVAWVSDGLAIYRGTSEQLPDPVVQSWYENNRAPAFRTTAYIRINHFKIDEFGHIPTFWALWENGLVDRRAQVRWFLERGNGDGSGGVPPDKIVLNHISGQQRGVWKSQPGPNRDIAEKLAALDHCRLVQIGDVITDVDLKNPTYWDVEVADLAANDESGGEDDLPSLTVRESEEEASLPSQMLARISDISLNHDENTVTVVWQTAEHQNIVTFDLPVVASEAEIEQWLRVKIAEAWAGRQLIEVSLPIKYIRVAPGDVLRIPALPNGNAANGDGEFDEAFELIVEEQTMGAPGPIVCRGRKYSADIYRDYSTITVSHPRPKPEIVVPGPLQWMLVDAHAGRDADTELPGFYAAFAATGPWSPVSFSTTAGIHVSNSAGSSSPIFNYPATMGHAPTALGNHAGGATHFDDANTLTVWLIRGSLSDASDAELFSSSANALLYGNEWLRFGAARYLGPNTEGYEVYELSHLLRGQSGTESFIGTHVGGEKVLLLDHAVVRINLTMSSIGRTVQWQAARGGSAPEYIDFAAAGRNLKPYSVAGLRGRRDGDGNLILSFYPRTRYRDDYLVQGAPAPRLTAPPDLDWYEIEILKGGAVVRTIRAGGVGPQVAAEYSAIEQAADGFAPGAAITARVYRLSSMATAISPGGRGYVTEATL